jgi:hypothetical protein
VLEDELLRSSATHRRRLIIGQASRKARWGGSMASRYCGEDEEEGILGSPAAAGSLNGGGGKGHRRRRVEGEV